MKAVIQRVSSAAVKVSSREVARIGQGFLLLLGIQKEDSHREMEYLVKKISGMRVFSDGAGKMNLSITDPMVQGEILAVSQFTLLGDLRKGRRPSFDRAEDPVKAESLFSAFIKGLEELSIPVKTGVFGAMMEVSLTNDGPVTFVLDTDVML